MACSDCWSGYWDPMTQTHADFRELERRNRNQTVALVFVFMVLFCTLGFGLDFVIGAVRLHDGHLVGFSDSYDHCADYRFRSVTNFVLRGCSVSTGVGSCAPARARFAEAPDGT